MPETRPTQAELSRLRAELDKHFQIPGVVVVTPDPEPWDGDVEWDGPLWIATLYDTQGRYVDSLAGIACHAEDPYLSEVARNLQEGRYA